MTARELLDLYRSNGPVATFTTHGAREIVESALALLAAAEANDGTSPETSALDLKIAREYRQVSGAYIEMLDHARTLERRCSGLAAEVGRLTKDAERYQFLRDAEYPEPLLLMLREPGIHRNFVDAAIDAERAK